MISTRVVPLLYGLAGTRQTLAEMQRFVEAATLDDEVVRAAHEATFGAPANDPAAEARAIFDWVRARYHYRADPTQQERVLDPRVAVRRIHERGWFSGDCDDVATLTAALAHSVALPVVFVVVGKDPAAPEHVYAALELRSPVASERDLLSLDLGRAREAIFGAHGGSGPRRVVPAFPGEGREVMLGSLNGCCRNGTTRGVGLGGHEDDFGGYPGVSLDYSGYGSSNGGYTNLQQPLQPMSRQPSYMTVKEEWSPGYWDEVAPPPPPPPPTATGTSLADTRDYAAAQESDWSFRIDPGAWSFLGTLATGAAGVAASYLQADAKRTEQGRSGLFERVLGRDVGSQFQSVFGGPASFLPPGWFPQPSAPAPAPAPQASMPSWLIPVLIGVGTLALVAGRKG